MYSKNNRHVFFFLFFEPRKQNKMTHMQSVECRIYPKLHDFKIGNALIVGIYFWFHLFFGSVWAKNHLTFSADKFFPAIFTSEHIIFPFCGDTARSTTNRFSLEAIY